MPIVLRKTDRVPSGSTLTQFGNARVGGFRDRPRLGREVGVSLIEGRLSAPEAKLVVARWSPVAGDAARHCLAGDLEAAGFEVWRAPTKRNPVHVTVEYPGDWDDDVSTAFSAAFGEPEVIEG